MRTSIPEVGTEQGEPQPTQGEKRGSKSLECVTFVVSRSPRHMYTHDCGKNPFLGGGGHYCLQNKHFSGGKADVALVPHQNFCGEGVPYFTRVMMRKDIRSAK